MRLATLYCFYIEWMGFSGMVDWITLATWLQSLFTSLFTSISQIKNGRYKSDDSWTFHSYRTMHIHIQQVLCQSKHVISWKSIGLKQNSHEFVRKRFYLIYNVEKTLQQINSNQQLNNNAWILQLTTHLSNNLLFVFVSCRFVCLSVHRLFSSTCFYRQVMTF